MQPPPIRQTLFRRPPRETSTPGAMTFSATVVLGPDLLQETLRSFFDEVQDVLELVGATRVRIGNLAFWGVGSEIEKGTNHCSVPAQSGNSSVIVLVHRKDVIEVLAILRHDAPRSLGADVYPAKGGGVHSPVVGRRSNVPVPGSGRVHENLAL